MALRLKTLHAVGNQGELVLLRFVPSEHNVLAWDKLKKLVCPLDDGGKMSEALCGYSLDPDRSPPFIAVPGLHRSLAQNFIHVNDDSYLLSVADLVDIGDDQKYVP
ncbi:hypothetical protein M1D32_10300 [Arthrobacter sp. D3-16]